MRHGSSGKFAVTVTDSESVISQVKSFAYHSERIPKILLRGWV